MKCSQKSAAVNGIYNSKNLHLLIMKTPINLHGHYSVDRGLIPVSCWHCDIILVVYTRDCRFEWSFLNIIFFVTKVTMLLPKSVSFYFHYWLSILIFTVWHFFERAHAELFTKCSDYDRIAHLLCSQSLTPSKRVNLQVLHLDTSYLWFLSQLNCVAYPVPVVIKIMVWTLRWEMKNCCLKHFQIYSKRLILQGQWTMQDVTSLINYCWDQYILDFWKV